MLYLLASTSSSSSPLDLASPPLPSSPPPHHQSSFTTLQQHPFWTDGSYASSSVSSFSCFVRVNFLSSFFSDSLRSHVSRPEPARREPTLLFLHHFKLSLSPSALPIGRVLRPSSRSKLPFRSRSRRGDASTSSQHHSPIRPLPRLQLQSFRSVRQLRRKFFLELDSASAASTGTTSATAAVVRAVPPPSQPPSSNDSRILPQHALRASPRLPNQPKTISRQPYVSRKRLGQCSSSSSLLSLPSFREDKGSDASRLFSFIRSRSFNSSSSDFSERPPTNETHTRPTTSLSQRKIKPISSPEPSTRDSCSFRRVPSSKSSQEGQPINLTAPRWWLRVSSSLGLSLETSSRRACRRRPPRADSSLFLRVFLFPRSHRVDEDLWRRARYIWLDDAQ